MKKRLVLAAMVSVLFVNSYGCSEEGMGRDMDVQPNVRRSISPVMAQVPQEQGGEENRESRLRALGITVIGVGTGIVLLYAGHLLLHAIEMYKFRNMLGDTPWFMR